MGSNNSNNRGKSSPHFLFCMYKFKFFTGTAKFCKIKSPFGPAHIERPTNEAQYAFQSTRSRLKGRKRRIISEKMFVQKRTNACLQKIRQIWHSDIAFY